MTAEPCEFIWCERHHEEHTRDDDCRHMHNGFRLWNDEQGAYRVGYKLGESHGRQNTLYELEKFVRDGRECA